MMRHPRLFMRLALMSSCLCATMGTASHAETYDVPVRVESPEDLQDLLENGDLDEDTFLRLYELLIRPLDLNSVVPPLVTYSYTVLPVIRFLVPPFYVLRIF